MPDSPATPALFREDPVDVLIDRVLPDALRRTWRLQTDDELLAMVTEVVRDLIDYAAIDALADDHLAGVLPPLDIVKAKVRGRRKLRQAMIGSLVEDLKRMQPQILGWLVREDVN